jgi:hypothetical protein
MEFSFSFFSDETKENGLGWACSTCMLICHKFVKGNFRGVENSEMKTCMW